MTDDIKKYYSGSDDDMPPANGVGSMPANGNGNGADGHAYLPESASAGGAAAQGEWDF
jgi:hypothetical protein